MMGVKKSRARGIVIFLQVILLAVAIVVAHGGTSVKAEGDIQITGTLTTNSGSDVSGVSVYATDPGTDNVEFGPVTSGDDGTYDLPVEAGSYDIHFDPPASDSMSSITDTNVMVLNDQTINEQFTAPTYTYSGILTDQNGDPLSNSEVVLYSTTGGPTAVSGYTSTSGYFIVSAPAGKYSVDISDAGYNRNGPQVIGQADVSDFQTGSITTVDLTGGPVTQNFAITLAQVTFVVEDSSGDPEQNVDIKATDASGTFSISDGSTTYTPNGGSTFTALTDQNSAPSGTAVELVPEGSVFPAATATSGTSQGVCVTYNDGSSACETSPVSINSDMTLDFNEPPTYTYSGILTDQNGNPIANSQVLLVPVGGSTQTSSYVGNSGQFSITVPGGVYNVELKNTSGEQLATYTTAPIATTDLTQGNQTQNLSLDLSRLTVEVKGATGNPEGDRIVFASDTSANITVNSGDGATYNSTADVNLPGDFTDSYGSVTMLVPEGTSFQAATPTSGRDNGVCVFYTDNTVSCSTIPVTMSTDTSLIFEEGSLVVQAIGSPASVTVTASPTGQNPVLTWNSVNGAVSYNIYRQGTEIGNTTSTSFTDTTATPGGYQYYVTAVDENGVESAPSDSVSEIVYTGPIITSTDSTSVGENSSLDFIVTTSGNPTPSVSEIGTLPFGVYFSHDNDGTGELYGSPTTGTSGSYPITLIASNAYGASSTQNFVLEVTSSPPSITSAASYEVNARDQANFTVTTTGDPTPSITESGSLPSGVTFTDNGDGTAAIAGIPVVGSTGTYPISITADNGSGTPATQTFTLTVTANNTAPSFVSSNSDIEAWGAPFSFTVETNGYPVPTIKKTGSLPSDVSFKDNGDGTATISGNPTANSDLGVYGLTFKAKSSQGTATQAFTLTITKNPVLKNITTKTATVGTPFSLNVTSTGYSTPSLSASGLPSGLSLTDNGNGTGTITGTPIVGTGGAYSVTITATNASGTTTETFTLKVKEGPVITSSSSATATTGNNFNFQVTATGYPAPSITKTGTLPKGITYASSTGTFSGTPASTAAGIYPITLTARNSQGTVTQSFVLTVE